MAGAFVRPVVCPIMVGRQAHLDALTAALAQVRAGQGQTLLITGEAGIGKSRLVNEASLWARAHNFLILRGQCFETDHALPYAPLLDLLRAHLADPPLMGTAQDRAQHGDELLRVFPELAGRSSQVIGDSPPDPEGKKRQRFDVLIRYLRRLASRQPLLILLEDLHWGDETTLEWLPHLVRAALPLPLGLLLTYRSDEIGSSLAHLLARFDRERAASELHLAPLAVADGVAMVRALSPDRWPIQRPLLNMIYEHSEGNPFFIEEIVKLLFIHPNWNDSATFAFPQQRPIPLPRTVQEAAQRRIRLLSHEVQRTLIVAAVAGRRFDFPLLALVLHCDEQSLIEQIKELIAAHLVVEELPDRFAFRHALTQRAVLANTLARERQGLHRQMATALAALATGDEQNQLGILAYHAFEAGDWAEAQSYAERAAAYAWGLNAPRATAEQATRALEAASRLGGTAPILMHRLRGLAREALGDFAGARADHEAVLALARAVGDRMSEWQAWLDLGALWASRDYRQVAEHLQQALALARELGDPARLVETLNRTGNWHANREELREALQYQEEGLAIAERLGDPRLRATTLDLLSMTYHFRTDNRRATLCQQEVLTLFERLGDQSSVMAARLNSPTFQGALLSETTVWEVRDYDVVFREHEHSLALVRAADWQVGEALAYAQGSWLATILGDTARALTDARAGIALAETMGHRQWLVGNLLSLGRTRLDLLDVPSALSDLEHAFAVARESRSLVFIRHAAAMYAQALLVAGDRIRAAAVLAEAEDRPEAQNANALRQVRAVRAELALACGEPDEALRIAEQLIATDANLTPGRAIPWLWHLRGEALARLGRTDESLVVLRTGAAEAAVLGMRPRRWRIDLALGRLLQQTGEVAAATHAFASARTIIAELADMVPDVALREMFVRRALALLPNERSVVQHRVGGDATALTAREREIASRIVRGLTNRQIADTLSISDETVAVHIKHILRKRAFGSRAQIAAWTVQQDWYLTN